MLIAIGGFLTVSIIVIWTYALDTRQEQGMAKLKKLLSDCKNWLAIWNAIVLVIIIVTLSASYDSYLDMKAFYDATVEQYATAITMYEDKAEIDVEKAAWTDLKYQGYQDAVSGLILDLRRTIVAYNTKFIKKQALEKNILFNWLIVGPNKDMKVIKMKTAVQ